MPSLQHHHLHLHSALDSIQSSSNGHSSQARAALRRLDMVQSLDQTAVLGGTASSMSYTSFGRSVMAGEEGHAGCVNALAWSSDGTLLASGSDDTRICLWKIGQDTRSAYDIPSNNDIVDYHPAMGMGLQASIHTGHRANIFSVKFSPTSSSTLYSCAADHEVRVFDLASEAATTSSSTSRRQGREWSEYPNRPLDGTQATGALTRVFKCHRGRVKRIATEPASDACFLTCSEDGTVRQHDLRVGHTCKRDCPPPLCDYRPLGMGLYSLSTTPLRPELFVVAGTSQYAYLHDRRMAPRTIYEQWGVPSNPRDLTQCVRRFGPPASAPTDGSEDEPEQDEGDEPGVAMPPHILAARQRARQARMRARAARRSGSDNHVTAAKLSSHNGRELLLTYSGGGACLYDIFAEPEHRRGSIAAQQSSRPRYQTGLQAPSEEHPEAASMRRKAESFKRSKMQLPDPINSAATPGPSALDFASLPPRAEDASDFVTSTSLADDERFTAVPVESTNEPEQKEEAFLPATASTSEVETSNASGATVQPAWQGFEIRVNEDGEIEMDIEEGTDPPTRAEDEEVDSDMNGEGLRQLLASTSGSVQQAESSSDESEEEDMDDEEEEDEESEDDEEDDISSSDDPDAAFAYSSDGHVPLVRPLRQYIGHRNVDTVKDVNFGGADDSLVMSGSDDGNLFIYRKSTSELLAIINADDSVVNVMQWHPYLPIIAVSGIDNSVKILGPTSRKEKRYSRLEQKEEITQKNRDASWTSEGLGIPHSALINLINRAVGEEGEEGQPRRIPLSMLMQLAQQDEAGEGGQDCVVM